MPTMSLGRVGYLDWGDWVYGLVSGFISGGASAVVAGVVVSFKDPEHYNPFTKNFYEVLFAVFLAAGVLNVMAFLRNKPLPNVKQVETTTKTVEPGPPTVVTTVKETHVEPIDSGKQGG